MQQIQDAHIELKNLEAVLANRYEVLDYLGSGGFGKVFKIKDVNTSETLALKVIHDRFCGDMGYRNRFSRETRIYSKLHHRSIAQIREYSREDIYPYIIMEYIEGLSLKQLIQKKFKFKLETLKQIVCDTLNGLENMHVNGIIHRDLKPGNIMIDQDTMHAKIIDFGLAKDMSSLSRLTTVGEILGTPAYSAPELITGNEPGPWTDIYSLGIIMFELVTGELPFKGHNELEVYSNHLNTPIPLPETLNPGVNYDLQRIIIKASAKDPARRFTSVGEMRTHLEEISEEKKSILRHRETTQKEETGTRTGDLVVVTNIDATISSGGKVLGKTVDNYCYIEGITEGIKEIEAENLGYYGKLAVKVTPGEIEKISINLEQKTGSLKIKTTAGRFSFTLKRNNYERVFKDWYMLEGLETGSYELEMESAGIVLHKKVEVAWNKTTEVDLIVGNIRVDIDAQNYKVRIGKETLTNPAIIEDVPEGVWEIGLEVGGTPITKQVRVEAGKVAVLELKTGQLKVVSRIGLFKVKIGNKIVEVPQVIKGLRPGHYKFEIISGYLNWEEKVNIKEGEMVTFEILPEKVKLEELKYRVINEKKAGELTDRFDVYLKKYIKYRSELEAIKIADISIPSVKKYLDKQIEDIKDKADNDAFIKKPLKPVFSVAMILFLIEVMAFYVIKRHHIRLNIVLLYIMSSAAVVFSIYWSGRFGRLGFSKAIGEYLWSPVSIIIFMLYTVIGFGPLLAVILLFIIPMKVTFEAIPFFMIYFTPLLPFVTLQVAWFFVNREGKSQHAWYAFVVHFIWIVLALIVFQVLGI